MQDFISFDVTGSPLVVTMMSANKGKDCKIICHMQVLLAQTNIIDVMSFSLELEHNGLVQQSKQLSVCIVDLTQV